MNHHWDPGAVWAYVGAVVLVIVGHQLQQGGIRRRRRRDIREEIELLELLGHRHAAVAARIRRRLDAALEQYEPSPESRIARLDRWLGSVALAVAIVAALTALLALGVTLRQPIQLIGISIAAGVFGIVFESALQHRLHRLPRAAWSTSRSGRNRPTRHPEL